MRDIYRKEVARVPRLVTCKNKSFCAFKELSKLSVLELKCIALGRKMSLLAKCSILSKLLNRIFQL
ncbi:unnamed protein product [Heterobilharzia americana]|nr:unnamed protein product [Heterobilharzia americana]